MTESFSTQMIVDVSPAEVLAAVRDPRAWWSAAIAGPTSAVGDEWVYSNGDLHACRMRVEHVTTERVEWLVLANHFGFDAAGEEWVGTRIVFDIAATDDRTILTFTHAGLVPEHECFEVCKPAWTHYIGTSLRAYLATGVGLPNDAGSAWVEADRVLADG